MRSRRFAVVLAIAVAGVLGGCAFGRDEIKLGELPASTEAARPSKGKSVFIRSVTDERVFNATGDDPTPPSLDTDNNKPEIKARVVARKRNGYQMALGDVLLEPGQTVAGKVGDALRQAFQLAGYTVVNEASSKSSVVVVDVRVTKFWTWPRKQFTVVTELAEVETELVIAGVKPVPLRIGVHTEDDKLVAGALTRADTLQKVLTAYRSEAVTKVVDLKL